MKITPTQVSIADNPLLCSASHSVLTHATEIKWRKIIFVNDFTFIFKKNILDIILSDICT